MCDTDQTRLGVWILDGDLHHRRLLKYALPAESLPHTLIMMVVSMAQPWNIMETLKQWGEVLNTHIDRLKVPPETRREYEEQCQYYNKCLVLWTVYFLKQKNDSLK